MSSRRRPLQPNAALAEMLARDAEREGRPFGGWGGEMARPERAATAPPPSAPLVIPEPDWEAERLEREADPPKESAA